MGAGTHALPEALTPFIGRRDELAELIALLDGDARLVTLTGVGGIGKTRLAAQIAAAAGGVFPGGTFFVDLAPLSSPALVDGALLESLGIGPQSGRSPLQASIEYLDARRALVVLDNCEHVIEPAAAIAERLLRACRDVRVLATSRVLLSVAGETAWPVPPLATQAHAGGDGRWSDAVELFCDRAARARPGLPRDERTRSVAERIVTDLDGIPLAIELAAARVRMLTPQEIADGLGDYLRMLRGGPRDAGARHRTMRGSLDWSYELLSDAERLLFARLSIFAGGWTIHAAEAVCGDDVLDTLAALVDRSLVVCTQHADRTRYRMLEFVRQYASEKLGDAARAELALRHRRYFLDFAGRADRADREVTADGRATLDAEAPNLRGAIDDACAAGHEDALRLVGALGMYWRERGRLSEGIAAVQRALDAVPARQSPERALALARLATLSFWRGDFDLVQPAAAEAIAIAQAADAARAHAGALAALGTLVMLSDPGVGDPMLREAAEMALAAGDRVVRCDALACLVLGYHFQEDRDALSQMLPTALGAAESIGYDNDVRWCLWASGHAALCAGDVARARELAERAADELAGDDPLGRNCIVELMAILDALSGDPQRARARAEGELERSRQETVRLGTGALMHALGIAALAAGDLDGARQWAGAICRPEYQAAGYLAWRAQEILMRAALAGGDSQAASAHADELNAVAERLGNRRALTVGRWGRARALFIDGQDDRADCLAHETLSACARHGWALNAIDALELVGAVAARRGRGEQAARCLAAAGAARAARGVVRAPPDVAWWDDVAAQARAAAGEQAYERALAEGEQMSLADAIAYAQRGRGERPRVTSGWDSLSPIERQVADLAARGMTNPEIARAVFVSRSTVKMHLSHVYAKLGVSNRIELARSALDPAAAR